MSDRSIASSDQTQGPGRRPSATAVGAVSVPGGVATAGAAIERRQPADLAEILERVLNTGIVIAGEIRIDLLDIELLTIKIRLIITSLDRAEEIGLDWWKGDAWYSGSIESDPSVVELVKESATDDAAESAVSPPAAEESAPTKRQAAKQQSGAKKSGAKKSSAKKSSAKKSGAKKSAKKQAAEKSTATKRSSKQAAAKRTVAQKTAAGRSPGKIRAENTGRGSARPVPETDDVVVAEAVVARAARGRS